MGRTPWADSHKIWCLGVAPHDLIKMPNFCTKIFRGFRSTWGQFPCFPVDFAGHRYNSALWLLLYMHCRSLHDDQIKRRPLGRSGDFVVSNENVWTRHTTAVLLSHVDQWARLDRGANALHILTAPCLQTTSHRDSRQSRNKLARRVGLPSRGHLPAGICSHTWTAVFIRHRLGPYRTETWYYMWHQQW